MIREGEDTDPLLKKREKHISVNDEDEDDEIKHAGATCEPGLVNIIMLGCGFLVLFTAFNAVQNLQTSVNERLGYISVGTLSVRSTRLCKFTYTLTPAM